MNTRPGRNTLRTIRMIVAVGATMLAFAYISWTLFTNWRDVGDLLGNVNSKWLLAHFLVVLAFFGSFPIVWRLVIRSYEIPHSFRTLVVSAYLPNLYKYIPGKIWAVASRVELLASFGPTSRKTAAAATVLGYLGEVLGAAPYFFLAAWIVPTSQVRAGSVAFVVVFGMVLLLARGLVFRALSWGLVKVGRSPLPESVRLQGLPTVLLSFMGYWSIYAVSGVFLARSVGVRDVSHSLLFGCALVAAWLIGFVSLLTPGGVGVREGVMTALLSPLVGPGSAAVVAIIARMSWTVGEFSAAGFALLMLRRSCNDAEETDLTGSQPRSPAETLV